MSVLNINNIKLSNELAVRYDGKGLASFDPFTVIEQMNITLVQ